MSSIDAVTAERVRHALESVRAHLGARDNITPLVTGTPIDKLNKELANVIGISGRAMHDLQGLHLKFMPSGGDRHQIVRITVSFSGIQHLTDTRQLGGLQVVSYLNDTSSGGKLKRHNEETIFGIKFELHILGELLGGGATVRTVLNVQQHVSVAPNRQKKWSDPETFECTYDVGKILHVMHSDDNVELCHVQGGPDLHR